jgi:hypothetical protein
MLAQTLGAAQLSKQRHPARSERVNDFAPLFVMNLLRKAVVVSG